MTRALLLCTFGLAAALTACGPRKAADTAEAPAAATPAPQATPEQAQAMLATLPAPYSGADLENGKKQFVKCKACHLLADSDRNTTGPNLWGVVGRKAGAHPGYSYSDPMKAAGFDWDPQHLDAWLTDPRGYMPGTKMSFLGLKDQKDRIDVIGYLKVAGSKPGA